MEPLVDGTGDAMGKRRKLAYISTSHRISRNCMYITYCAGQFNSRMPITIDKAIYLLYLFQASSLQIIGNTITTLISIIFTMELELEFACTSNILGRRNVCKRLQASLCFASYNHCRCRHDLLSTL